MAAVADKQERLLQLARRRQSFVLAGTPLEGHFRLGDFASGAYECDFVSPWSKSAHNASAALMVVGQDWASADFLRQSRKDVLVEFGYDPSLQTNRNLQGLLERTFGLAFADVYATNAFAFVKAGGMDAPIRPRAAMDVSVREFLLPQIEVIQPALTICLGKNTFDAVRRSQESPNAADLAEAIASPLFVGTAKIACVAHTGARGTNGRGREQVERDWQALRSNLN